MKKTTKIVACLLCCIMVSSLLIAIIDKINVYASIADYETPYNAQTLEKLETLTQRTSVKYESDETSNQNEEARIIPPITVFTHGCGGSASHWSSDSNYNFAK